METCLNAAFSKPKSGTVRVSIMSRESSWKMLDKPLRAILIVAAHEQEAPVEDEDDDTASSRRPSMPRHRGRMRRSGRQTGPPHMTWLHKPQIIIDESPLTAAYRLAALLIHKQMDTENWDEAWNLNETALREECMANGVHPVWHTVGEKTPLLGQFLAFPKAKSSKTVTKKPSMGTDFFWIDPRQKSELVTVLKLASAGVDDPDIKVALQKATHQLSGNRQLTIEGPLKSLQGSMAFITYLLHLHHESEASDTVIKTCKNADEDLAAALQDFAQLRSGKVTDWTGLLDLQREDSLTLARQTLGWQHAPAEAEACTPEQLARGLELLEASSVHKGRDTLTWWRLKALLREDQQEEAMEVLNGIRLDASSDVAELLPLLIGLNHEDANAWLMGFMKELSDQALFNILKADALSNDLRVASAQRLCDEQGILWEEAKSSVLSLLLQTLDIERLSRLFATDNLLALSNPYAALLVSHLAPASLDAELRSSIFACRTQALHAIHGADVPDELSPLAEHLLLLMEGIYKETPEVAEVLTPAALKAFSPISRALEGEGVVNPTHIRNLGASLDELDLSRIEHRLFRVMLLTLTMNGHLRAYNIGMASDADAQQLNELLDDDALPLRLIRSFSYLAMEHDLGLPNLVSWYQQNEPLSPWAPLVRAALFASQGDELNSAREYTRAAELFGKLRSETEPSDERTLESDDNDSALALPLALYRKSLIHYAHATSWAEAVDLLERVPALKTAITERFKLYLRVCHTAKTDTNAASRLIRKHVQIRTKVTEEDVEGNLVERTKTTYDEEELDVLRSYPFQKAHLLPEDPFLGRVMAASTHISRDLRRSRTQHQHQFRQAMQAKSPSLDEIYDVAKSAAEESGFEGLMYLERAQNSTKFSVASRARLAGVEQSLFSQHKDEIPVSKRRFLHNLNLTPLVIVDTNILVDALVEKVYQRMNLVFETNVNIIGSNRFHRILLHHAQAKRVLLMIPDDVRGELRQFAKDHRLLPRFQSAMIDADTLQQTLNEDVMLSMVDEVLVEFNTWTPTSEMLANLPSSSDVLDTFLKKHSDVFEELSELKALRGVTYRTELDGRNIYPEATDLDVYRLATHLASQPLPDVRVVLVATMDGDFTLLDRAIEEKFGFSVTKNNRTLKPWLKHQV